MPTLNWLGKDKVVNYDLDVPFHVLNHVYNFGGDTQNKIIHGDNLLALKSLLPLYEGKVKCIYIDPPYNTGNENWVYNDNVNSPQIQKWLGQVVGKEGEDFSRHDKWLCMMYPRLKLLKKLLADDGAIFISIDDNEVASLKFICDEIFGSQNFIAEFIWKKRYQGAKEKRVVILHEYIFMYAKNLNNIGAFFVPATKDLISRNYKYTDENFATRGPYRTQPLEAGNSMDDRFNLREPIKAPDGSMIYPRRQWVWSSERINDAMKFGEIGFLNKNGKWSAFIKQYLINRDGTQRMTKPFSIIDDVYTQDGTKEIENIFENSKAFSFPKPSRLIEKILQIATDKNSIVLDSFAGSGTTAHAVINLNAQDGGNRKFILVEMESYAENITAERVRRVGGSFDFYEVGEELFIDDELNENLPLEKIREYIWTTETATPYIKPETEDCAEFLGVHKDTAYYFKFGALDYDFLSTMRTRADEYVIFAETCAIDEEFLYKYKIEFRKIPRDLLKY